MKTIRRSIYRVLAVLLVVVLLASAGITLNERWWHNANIPSWQQIYVACGFIKPSVSADELHVTVLNVGDADCILLQTGDETMLIDAGRVATAERVLDALYAAGVDRFEHIIATHFDEDHIGGMATVLRAFDCDRVWMPASKADSVVYREFSRALRERSAVAAVADFGQTFTFGKAHVTLMGAQKTDIDTSNDNDDSLVCRITFGEHAFLFMADVSDKVERALMETDAALTADVIKIAHHGSSDATDPDFIARVKPTYAVITCKSDPKQLHPHRSTLETLVSNGVTVYRTDIHGTIFISSDGTTLSVTGEYK